MKEERTYDRHCIGLFSKPYYPDGSYDIFLNENIIRYMSFQKFKSLITSSKLYFANSYKVSDKREGLPSEKDMERLQFYDKHIKGWKKISKDKLFHKPNLIKNVSFLSCWSNGNLDKIKCWNRYIKNDEFGVAIITTKRKLRDSLIINDVEKHNLFFHGDVEYGTYTRYNDPYSLFFRKDLCFNWEDEYRVLFQGIKYPVSGKSSIKIGLPKDGIQFDIDLHNLIEKIILKPSSTKQQYIQTYELMNSINFTECIIANSNIK